MTDLKKFMLLGVTTQSTSHKEMEKAISKKKMFLNYFSTEYKSILFEGRSQGEFFCLIFCPRDVLCSLALFHI